MKASFISVHNYLFNLGYRIGESYECFAQFKFTNPFINEFEPRTFSFKGKFSLDSESKGLVFEIPDFIFAFEYENKEFLSYYLKTRSLGIHHWNQLEKKEIEYLKVWLKLNGDINPFPFESIPPRPRRVPDIIMETAIKRIRNYLDKTLNDKFAASIHTDNKKLNSVLYVTLKNGYDLKYHDFKTFIEENNVIEDLTHEGFVEIFVRSESLNKTLYTLPIA